MLEPFATLADYVARYGDVEASEVPKVEELLKDASMMLAAELGSELDTSNADLMERLKVVTRSMAGRAFSSASSDILAGATQTTQTAGPYSASYTFANPTSDLYITRQEKRLLGIGSSQIRSIAAKCLPPLSTYDSFAYLDTLR